MSHFTTIKTKITDMETLKKALTDLRYSFEVGKVNLRGFSGTETVDMVVKTSGEYDIGFRLKGSSYEIVGDWWGIPVNKEKFIADVTQRYAYHTVVSEAQNLGFTVSEEEKQKDGCIRVVVQRWR